MSDVIDDLKAALALRAVNAGGDISAFNLQYPVSAVVIVRAIKEIEQLRQGIKDAMYEMR